MSADRQERLAGEIALALTKRMVIDMPTARAAVDDAFRSLAERKRYGSLVMAAWDRFEADDSSEQRRDLVERKTAAHFKAKQTF